MSSVTCRRCGRELRRRASIEAGIGAVCAAKEGCAAGAEIEAPVVSLDELLRTQDQCDHDDPVTTLRPLDELVRDRVAELGALTCYHACLEKRSVAITGERMAELPERRLYVVTDDEHRELLRHVVAHSPDGMAWGYGGSAPADTALSILVDALGDARLAHELHQSYKHEVVASWPVEGATVDLVSVLVWAHRELESRRVA